MFSWGNKKSVKTYIYGLKNHLIKRYEKQEKYSAGCPATLEKKLYFSIGIKHGFSCINICQVPWEVLKTEAFVFNTSQGNWRMLMHWKTMFDRYYCIKTGNICYISRYFLHYFVSPFHRCLANVISTDYACSRAGQYTSRNGSKSVAPVRSYWK